VIDESRVRRGHMPKPPYKGLSFWQFPRSAKFSWTGQTAFGGLSRLAVRRPSTGEPSAEGGGTRGATKVRKVRVCPNAGGAAAGPKGKARQACDTWRSLAVNPTRTGECTYDQACQRSPTAYIGYLGGSIQSEWGMELAADLVVNHPGQTQTLWRSLPSAPFSTRHR
jgi:hypothetical protein